MEGINLFSEQTGGGAWSCRSKHMWVAKDDETVFGARDGNVQHVVVHVVELAGTDVIFPIDAGEQDQGTFIPLQAMYCTDSEAVYPPLAQVLAGSDELVC